MRSQCHQQQTRNLPKLHRHSALSSGNALFFFFSSELYQNLFVIAVCISTWSKFITTLSFFVCVCRWRPSMWPRLNLPYPAKTFSTKILAQNQTHCVFCCRMWEMTSGLRYATLDWNKLFELWDLMGFSAGVVSSWYWLSFFFFLFFLPPFVFLFVNCRWTAQRKWRTARTQSFLKDYVLTIFLRGCKN